MSRTTNVIKTGAARQKLPIQTAIIACLLLILALSPTLTRADNLLHAGALRVAGDETRTRLVIDFDRKPDFSVRYLENPFRTIVDINADVSFDFPEDDAEPKGIYSRIRYGAMSLGHTRIVLTSNRPTALELSEAQENENGSGYRLVLGGTIVTEQKLASLVHEENWQEVRTTKSGRGGRIGIPTAVEQGLFVVAVDAGHGGIDDGATGRKSGIAEKVITLQFAKDLVEELNKRPHFRAFLTRDKDVFLSLSERVQIARQSGANLLISLHADTLRQTDIRGATVYTISDKASDGLAAELAKRENISDEIAGVASTDSSDDVSDILIDLARRETQTFSESLAQSVVKSFEGQVELINNPHRYAGFRVLRAPDVPSVLLELGFLSNTLDEKLLMDPEHQKTVAKLIADATERYRSTIGGQ